MISLLNAAPDTGNQGVSALCLSAVSGLAARGAGPISVADHGRGCRRGALAGAQVDLVGLSPSRRFWRAESLGAVRALVGLGGGPSPTARHLARSAAILDASGGDSFTDLYGPRRFRAMAGTKRLALSAGARLILLPQTLGPFRDKAHRAEAARLLRAARAVWVRDMQSLETLRDLLGDAFDPEHHRAGVDMALALPRRQPRAALGGQVDRWLAGARGFPLAGLNVSGLLCNQPEAARARFGLAKPHPAQIEAAARAVLASDPDMHLLLVPHVHRPQGDPESDLAAAEALSARLGPDCPGRVEVLRGNPGAMELKWVLSRLDWFAGARMHATIGAFSSGVPTLGLGYSDKAEGVFEQCGLGGHVADLRIQNAEALAAEVSFSVARREETRAALATRLPALLARAEAQMDEIVRQAGS